MFNSYWLIRNIEFARMRGFLVEMEIRAKL